MRILVTAIFIFLFCSQMQAQVGINTTSPNATLDIVASDATAPTNQDGLLIPRIDEFPGTDPTAAQDGMLVFVTGNGSETKGFYYWDQGTTNWVLVNGAGGGTLDNAYDFGGAGSGRTITADNGAMNIAGNDGVTVNGNIGIGSTSNDYPLRIDALANTNPTVVRQNISGDASTIQRSLENRYFGSNSSAIYSLHNYFSSDVSGSILGVRNDFISFGTAALYGISNYFNEGGETPNSVNGVYNRYSTLTTTISRGMYNQIPGASSLSGEFRGIDNSVGGSGDGIRYGVYNSISGSGTGIKYGTYNTIPSSAGGTHYGVYSDVQSTSGFAGYFRGRVSFGTGLSNRYFMPENDGTNGQVLTTDGSGNITFSTPGDDGDWTVVGSDIERQSGDVYIGDDNATDNDLYISNDILDWDNTSYLLDPSEESAVNEINFDAGSQTDPSIHFGPDTNTGFYRSATDAISITTNDTEKFRFTNDGRIEYYNNGASVFLGQDAGRDDDLSGNQNTALGYRALRDNTSGERNIAIGSSAMLLNDGGNTNIAIGDDTMGSSSGGNNNTAIGIQSLYNVTTGSNNVAIGRVTMRSNTEGSDNIAMGDRALWTNTTGNNNLAIGAFAGFENPSGSNNTYIGDGAGRNNEGSANVFIGNGAGSNDTMGSNRLYVENTNSATPLIYGEFDNDFVRINGGLQVGIPSGTGYALPTTDGTANQILQTDGAGQITFIDPSSIDSSNTLDEAYDEGGAGAGRIITADNGAVEIQSNGGLRVVGSINAGDYIVHDGDVNTNILFNPDRVEIDAGGFNYIDIENSSSEIAFNEDSNALDFRVESDGQANMLFVDGSQNTVGIGEGAPISPLQIGIQTSWDLAVTNSGQDGIFMRGSGDNSGQNTIGSSIAFGAPSNTRSFQRKAAIASIQTGGDEDNIGFGFFVHRGDINLSDMVEGMRLTHDRYLGINNTDPSANLDVVGTMQFVDGNQSNSYVLSSDANGNATWSDPSSLISDTNTQNTLDEAYDEGGAGAGRTIIADNGAVDIQGNDGLRVEGVISAAEIIQHDGDTDTYTQFTADRLRAFVGGINYMDIQNDDAEITFNEASNEVDFRVESDDNTHMLFIDASRDAVGIGRTAPRSPLEIGVSTSFDLGYTNTGQDGIFLRGSDVTSANNAVGASIGFGAPVRPGFRRAAISTVQTSVDEDHVGLAFYIHKTAANLTNMEEGMRLSHEGFLGINTTAPSATLDVVGSMQFVDGNQSNGYVLTSDANGNASWADLPASTDATTASNGLTESGDDIRLGGTLTQATAISQGVNTFDINLNDSGDFAIQDNGTDVFFVEDSGDIGFGTSNPNYRVDISETTTSETRAVNISKSDNTSASTYGVYNAKTGAGTGRTHALFNDANSTGSGFSYAIYNLTDGSGTGQKYGTFNEINSTATGSQYGTRNWIRGTTTAGQFGVFNNMINSSSGAQYGVYNGMRNSGGSSQVRGVHNEFGTAGNVDEMTGIRNQMSDGTPGSVGMQGVYSVFSNSNNGDFYGNRTEYTTAATGTGNKYGSYNLISSSAGGVHYGTYNEVSTSAGWAGYFVGRNYISDRLSIGRTSNTIAHLGIDDNSSSTGVHMELTETQANDGARIRFSNSSETANQWTLYGRADDTDGDSQFNIFYSATGNIIRIEGDGKVGIMRNPSTNALEVGGDASKTSAGDWLANSDQRLKKNIKTIDSKTALERITNLRGVSYEWNDNQTGYKRPEGIQYGFIAQELMEVFPEHVTKDNDGYYQTAYGTYDALYVQAFKEQQKQIENLKSENEALKEQLSRYQLLEARIKALENRTSQNDTMAQSEK